jgi:hypothetical protein
VLLDTSSALGSRAPAREVGESAGSRAGMAVYAWNGLLLNDKCGSVGIAYPFLDEEFRAVLGLKSVVVQPLYM